MLKEAAIFDCEHRIHQRLRNLLKPDDLALGALLPFKQSRHQLRFQLVGLEVLAVFPGLVNGGDLAVLEVDHGAFFGVEGLRPGNYLDSMRRKGIMADRRIVVAALLRVSRAMQISGDVLRVQLLSDPDSVWAGVDPGSIAEDRPRHAAVHDVLVLHIKVGEHRHEDEGGDQKDRSEELHQRIGD